MKSRKAQISQVFTYLMIIIVVGVVVIFGYKGISSILSVDCDKQRIAFENDLLSFINEYSDKGSVHEEIMGSPCSFEEVCIVDSDYCPRASSTLAPVNGVTEDQVIISSADDCAANIFLMGEFTEILKSSEKFSTKVALKKEEQPLKCFKARAGEFNFVFRGKGRKTQIESAWD